MGFKMKTYLIITQLREKAKQIKTDRFRLKAHLRRLRVEADALTKAASNLVDSENYAYAKAIGKQNEKICRSIESLNRLDYNLEYEQKMIGLAIVKMHKAPYASKVRKYEIEYIEAIEEALVLLSRTGYYACRNYDGNIDNWF